MTTRGRGGPVTRLPDGTIKQVNPLSGTEVWTVPGRRRRALVAADVGAVAEGTSTREVPCVFCLERAEEVPPEKARVVRGPGPGFRTLTAVPPEASTATTPEFRRLPNLFEIVSYEYWRQNHGHRPSAAARARHDRWLTSTRGRASVLKVLRHRFLAGGGSAEEWDTWDESARLAHAMAFFAGGHDLIVPRRHLTDGEDGRPQVPASSGTLTPAEHAAYVRFTVETMAALYEEIPASRYVVVFQNWLGPAGASVDHLHRQLVTLDEHGVQIGREVARLRDRPGLYAEYLAWAREHDLVVAENDHAVAFAGVGHRYPTLEVWAKDTGCRPFEMAPEQIDGVSDLLHALHAAGGPDLPCNEEWHHRPIDVETARPWRIELKWRVSTPAGFEGGTRIFVTTISPWDLRDRVARALAEVQERNHLAAGIRLARRG